MWKTKRPDDDLSKAINASLKAFPGMPRDLHVKTREDYDFLDLTYEGLTGSLQWTNPAVEVAFLKNANIAWPEEDRWECLRKAIDGLEMEILLPLVMMSLAPYLAREAERQKASSMLGLTNPRSDDHVMIDRYIARKMHAMGDNAAESCPGILELLCERSHEEEDLEVDIYRDKGMTTGFYARSNTKLAWLGGRPIPLITIDMPVNQCEDPGMFDGTLLQIEAPKVYRSYSLRGMKGKKVGEIVKTGADLDDRTIIAARQTATSPEAARNILKLTLEVDPVPINEATPDKVKSTDSW